jgi:hypothetical protein
MPNRLRHADAADDHDSADFWGWGSNRTIKRNKEHVVRDRLHYDPAHMSNGMLPTVLPNWTIKRAGQDAANRGEYREAVEILKCAK